MDLAALQAFEGAIDDQREVLAAVASNDQTHSFTASLLKRNNSGFWFQTSAWPGAFLNSATTNNLRVSIVFGTSGAAVQLQADMLSLESSGADPDSVIVRCAKPGEIALVQRRAHFRVPVPAGAPLLLTVWKIPDHWVLRDKPKPSTQLRVELLDISPGGVCVKVLPHRLGPDSISPGDRLRAELSFGESSAVFDGRVIHHVQLSTDAGARVGVAFRQLDNTIEGRRASVLLDRVIGSLQRIGIKETTDASAA